MSVTGLLIDLMQLGVRLEAPGARLRYYPRSSVTPELAGRMKLHKAELIANLGSQDPEADAPKPTLDNAMPCPVCGCCLFWLDGGNVVHCEICQPRLGAATRAVARLCLINTPVGDDWELVEPADIDQCEIIDPPDPCSRCSSIMFWWNAWGQRRCMNCDPPAVAERLLERVQDIRERTQPG